MDNDTLSSQSPLRKILHIDMDAFFASVEQRDFERLRDKPVIVGGQPDSRAVVAACSYQARVFGVRSAMSCAEAYRRCPDAIFVRPRFDVYREVSKQIRKIFADYSDLIEPLSLDEAYLDVSDAGGPGNWIGDGSATALANAIRQRIAREQQLTASAGVSYNKFLAKIASDINKPNGIYVVNPEQALDFIAGLKVGRINGVGRVTEAKMQGLGIYTGADLRAKTQAELTVHFGKLGKHFYNLARGIDQRPVQASRQRKSVGIERTYAEDLVDYDDILQRILGFATSLSETMRAKRLKAKTITIKLKYNDFVQLSRSRTLSHYSDELQSLEPVYRDLLASTEVGSKPIRLLGLSVSSFENHEPVAVPMSEQSQLGLF